MADRDHIFASMQTLAKSQRRDGETEEKAFTRHLLSGDETMRTLHKAYDKITESLSKEAPVPQSLPDKPKQGNAEAEVDRRANNMPRDFAECA